MGMRSAFPFAQFVFLSFCHFVLSNNLINRCSRGKNQEAARHCEETKVPRGGLVWLNICSHIIISFAPLQGLFAQGCSFPKRAAHKHTPLYWSRRRTLICPFLSSMWFFCKSCVCLPAGCVCQVDGVVGLSRLNAALQLSAIRSSLTCLGSENCLWQGLSHSFLGLSSSCAFVSCWF